MDFGLTYGSLEKLHHKFPDPTKYRNHKQRIQERTSLHSVGRRATLHGIIRDTDRRLLRRSPLAGFHAQTHRREQERDVITISSLFPQTIGL